MGLMTQEEKDRVPGGVWSVVGVKGLVSECRTQQDAFSEVRELSKNYPDDGPYSIIRGYHEKPKPFPKELQREFRQDAAEIAIDNQNKLKQMEEVEANLLGELQSISQCRTTQEPKKVVIEKLQEQLNKIEEQEKESNEQP